VEEGVNKREKASSFTPQGKVLYKQAQGPWKEAQKNHRKIIGQGQDDLLIELGDRKSRLKSNFWVYTCIRILKSTIIKVRH